MSEYRSTTLDVQSQIGIYSRKFSEVINSKVLNFNRKCLERSKLVGPKYAQTVDLSGPPPVYKKSLSRLRTLIAKEINKRIPLLVHAPAGFLFLKNSAEPVISVVLSESDWQTEIVPVNALTDDNGEMKSAYAIASNTQYRQIYGEAVGINNSLERYCRYLRYLAIKNRIPVRIGIEYDTLFDDSERARLITSIRGNAQLAKTGKIPFKTTVSLEFKFGRWGTEEICLTQAIQGWSGENVDDTIYREIGPDFYWNFQAGHGAERSARWFHQSRVFANLHNLLKVLETISRTINYDITVYSVGDSETPDTEGGISKDI